ncbi:MAG: diacylglycerol kinase family lipid kinase [Actinomycetota bacterium]|nr:diacylglycerol kinase family lipid kinase [Actinomycetota bacterium]
MHKVMLISNLYAGSVSRRTQDVIVKALQADFKLEAVETASRDHASNLATDAVDRGFDAVLAFGGDGTINETAQGLVGTETALGVLPGGSTNVMARSLGVPADPVEATAFVGARLRSDTRRRINVGVINDRVFLFSAGMGLDAEVVKRVERDAVIRREKTEWLFVSNALRAGLLGYRGMDPCIDLGVGDDHIKVMTAVCCNARPFTYYKRFPLDVCPQATLDEGLDVFGLKKLSAWKVPRLAWALFVSRSHIRWRSSYYRHDITEVELSADRDLPVQVDGDYLGEWREAGIRLRPEALDLVV